MSPHPEWGGSSFFSSNQNNVNKNGKFFVIQSRDLTKKLGDLNPFCLKKGFDNITTHIKDIIKQKDGSVLLSTLNETGNNKISKATKFIDLDIEVTEHKKLNNSQGIIYCRDLNGMEKEVIQEELKDQGVCDVYIMNKMYNNIRRPNGLYILTFNTTSTPQYIKIGYSAIEVRTYIPNPLRCMNCQLFGHSKNNCTSDKALCGICSDELPHNVCEIKKCLNCKGEHESFSRKCPVYMEEAEIMRIKTLERISFSEARRRVKVRTNMNFAETLINQNNIEHIQLKKDFLTMKKEIDEIKRNDVKLHAKIEQLVKEKNNAIKSSDNLTKSLKIVERKLQEQIIENENLKALLLDGKSKKKKAETKFKVNSKKQRTYIPEIEEVVEDSDDEMCDTDPPLQSSNEFINEQLPNLPTLTPINSLYQGISQSSSSFD